MVLLAIYQLYQVYINVYQFLFGVNIKLAYCILQHNYFGLAQLVTFFLTASNGLPRAGPGRAQGDGQERLFLLAVAIATATATADAFAT